jgi:hypothetical protein
MRREKAFKRGRWLSLLLAGFIGYLLGDWHAAVLRSADLSPSQNVALRFPEAKADAAVADAAADMPMGATSTMVLGDAQLALLSPQPMVPEIVPRPAAQAAVTAAGPSQAAAAPLPQTTLAHRSPPMPAPSRSEAKAAAPNQPRAELKSAPIATSSRHADRAGSMLNDAQIASIKERLHLTPDQERMWPAVEAALRNVAYAKVRDARRHGAPAGTEVASLDPDSAEVQGLKSAAVPLIMSFSDEQKNEVRSLAHVMGLDRLASEF